VTPKLVNIIVAIDEIPHTAMRMPGNQSRSMASRLWILPILMLAAQASAQCIDVVDVSSDLPQEISTSNGASISYSYDLGEERYVVRTVGIDVRERSYGPFLRLSLVLFSREAPIRSS